MSRSPEVCPSALQIFLSESLAAFPDDSHSKLCDHFERSGESQLALDRFKQLWSKAYASSRVFGQNRGVDVSKLCQALAEDGAGIAGADSTAANRIGKQFFSDRPLATTTVDLSAAQVYSSLRQLDGYESQLKQLRGVLRRGCRTRGDRESAKTDTLTELMYMRKSCRGMKISWTGQRSRSQCDYTPLNLRRFKCMDVIYGVGEPRHNIPVLTSTSLMGIKLSSERPLLQAATWQIFADLTLMSAAQDGSLFPFAVEAYREGASAVSGPYSMFVFESPHCVPLSPLLGGELAMNLRRHADIIELWASQLGKAFHAASNFQTGTLLNRSITAANLFVREDGRLIIGNLCPAARTGTNGSGEGDGNFALFSINILRSALCLSRVDKINASTRHRLTSDSRKSEINNSGSNSKLREVAVTLGSSISFVLCDFPPHCLEVCLDTDSTNAEAVGADSSSTSPGDRVRIQILQQTPVFEHKSGLEAGEVTSQTDPVVSVSCDSSFEKILIVNGKGVGEALVKITYTSNIVEYLETEMGEQDPTDSIFVRVQVLPHIDTASTAVHELIGLLEATSTDCPLSKERETWNAAVDAAHLVFQARCMQMDFSCEENGSPGRFSRKQQWASIRRSVSEREITRCDDENTRLVPIARLPTHVVSEFEDEEQKPEASATYFNDDTVSTGELYRYGAVTSAGTSVPRSWK